MLLALRSLWEQAGEVTGTVDLTEADDLLASAVLVLVQGAAGLAEASDAGAGGGVVLVAGSAAITEAADSLDAAAGAGVTAAATLAEGDESLAAIGAVLVAGDLSSTEADEALEASGSAGGASADLDIIEDADELAADVFVQDPLVSVVGIAEWPREKLPPYLLGPVLCNADIVEADDGVSAAAAVSGRTRRIRELEYLLRRAA